jgi:hypothetical protein
MDGAAAHTTRPAAKAITAHHIACAGLFRSLHAPEATMPMMLVAKDPLKATA